MLALRSISHSGGSWWKCSCWSRSWPGNWCWSRCRSGPRAPCTCSAGYLVGMVGYLHFVLRPCSESASRLQLGCEPDLVEEEKKKYYNTQSKSKPESFIAKAFNSCDIRLVAPTHVESPKLCRMSEWGSCKPHRPEYVPKFQRSQLACRPNSGHFCQNVPNLVWIKALVLKQSRKQATWFYSTLKQHCRSNGDLPQKSAISVEFIVFLGQN